MNFKTARFVTSFAASDKYAEYAANCKIPEICVVGRSNVGKSTFINMLTAQAKLAKTSSTPGRTRLINIFDVNEGQFRLVDLPGYGYALAAKSSREEWDGMIEGYLLGSENLKHILLLVDSRHEPSKLDVAMTQYMYYHRLPFTVIATKCDKLSKAEVGRSAQTIATALKIGRDNIICVDAKGFGREKVADRLESVLNM